MKKKQKQKTQKVVKFKAKTGSWISDKQANVYGIHILSLLEKNNLNSITAKAVLEDAKNENTPYHEHFKWDNDLAGREYRLMQARQLISNIVEVKILHEEEVPMRVFVNVVDEVGDRVYVPTEYAMAKPMMADQVIAKALKEAKGWASKYKEFKELSKIRAEIDSTHKRFTIGGD